MATNKGEILGLDMDRNCENCIHKEVCKFKETATAKKVEEPFVISCKHYMNSNPTYRYSDNWAFRGTGTARSTCDSCGFYDKAAKKCTIEDKAMGIVGLPCQQTVTCNATSGVE